MAGVRTWFKRLVLLLVLILLLACAGLVVAWHSLERWLNQPLNVPAEGHYYQLSPGGNLGSLTRDLARQEILDKPQWLRIYARLTQVGRIQAGEYRLEPGLTPLGLLEKLQKGDVVMHQITLVEGWTYAQALAAIQAREELVHLLSDLTLEEQAKRLGLPGSHPEGWFFPDTYTFARGSSDLDLLKRAHLRMRQLLDELWEKRADNLPYKNPYEALIMASIIERETGAPWERDQVAGVFVRRLQKGMRLQTDPTVIYGMGSQYQGRITRKDLNQSTPYNTYVIQGLPPTPIALPGRASLEAALNPAEGSALYFVAKGDGTSHFSSTLEEHNRAVRRYQLRRAQDYRSTLIPPTENEKPAEAGANSEPSPQP